MILAKRRAYILPSLNLFLPRQKNWACVSVAGYYAQRSSKPENVVFPIVVSNHAARTFELSSAKHRNVCGAIIFEMPSHLPDELRAEYNDAYKAVAGLTSKLFMSLQDEISSEVENMLQTFFPRGRNFPRANNKFLIRIASRFQNDVAARFRQLAQDSKWNDTFVSEFASRTGCASLLPKTTEPNEAIIAIDDAAFAVYTEIKQVLEQLPHGR